MQVLVVEDNKAVSLIICRIIEELGHEYVLAAEGEAALRLYNQRPIDLLVCDIELPLLDGFSVARAVRDNADSLPILFVSANSSDAYRQQCRDVGGVALLAKPLRPSELRHWLDTLLTDITRNTAQA